MSLKSVTFEADEQSLTTIDEIAANREVDRGDILRDAIALYVAHYEQLKAGLEEADKQVEAGDFLTHEEVVARFEARIRGTVAA